MGKRNRTQHIFMSHHNSMSCVCVSVWKPRRNCFYGYATLATHQPKQHVRRKSGSTRRKMRTWAFKQLIPFRVLCNCQNRFEWVIIIILIHFASKSAHNGTSQRSRYSHQGDPQKTVEYGKRDSKWTKCCWMQTAFADISRRWLFGDI